MKIKLLINTLLASTLFVGLANARPGNGGQGGQRPDPEEMVAKLIADFDADESNTLNVDELTKALTAMHEKHMQRKQQKEQNSNNKKERPTPADRSSRFIEEFDADSDGALNSEELMLTLKEMGPGRKRN